MAKNINRIDHVVAKVAPEQLEPTIAQLSWSLQTAFYGPFDRVEDGIRCAVSWDAGIELIAPLNSAEPITPGWISVVYGVRDLDQSVAHLKESGHEPRATYSGISGVEPWVERYERFDEASYDPALFAGLPMVLCQAEEHPDQPPATATSKNINRIDHVVGKVPLEQMDATIAQLSSVLQTAFYAPFGRPEAGIRVAVSWDAGIELIAPLNPSDEPVTPGWVSVVYGVRDLDQSVARLMGFGHEPRFTYNGISGIEPWIDRYERFDEASYDPALFAGLPMVLCQVDQHSDQVRGGVAWRG